jgi:hypothetical protein
MKWLHGLIDVNENRSLAFSLRVRFISQPKPGELDGIELDCYHVGQVYVLPSRLATLLILGGHAELVENQSGRAEAAEFGQPQFPKRQ